MRRGPREPETDQGARWLELFGKHRQSGVAQIRDATDGSCLRGHLEVLDEPRQRETFGRHERYTRVGEASGFR